VFGFLLLIVAVLSFTRGVQRMFEQTWELKPLSVRNTVNGLIWVLGLSLYSFVSGVIHASFDETRLELGANLLMTPFSLVFLVWSGYVLTAKRIPWRELIPFGLIGAAGLAVYSTGAAVYVPHLFSSYATRYGVIGAVFAMISSLFCMMVVVVASSSVGREVSEELRRIREGERPPDDEIRQEWDAILAEARSRLDAFREQIDRRRRGEPEPVQQGAARDPRVGPGE